MSQALILLENILDAEAYSVEHNRIESAGFIRKGRRTDDGPGDHFIDVVKSS